MSDVRRKSDINWFKESYSELIRTVKISADDDTRISRGYEFKSGVDDVMSECDLDDYTEWDLVINNGQGSQLLEEQLGSILGLLAHL